MSVAAVERLLGAQAARMARSALSSELRVSATVRRSVPGDTTYDEVAAARNALGSRPGGEDIKLLRVTEAIPILEPLLQTFAAAVDKSLQDRIERSYDRAMEAALRTPRSRPATVEREAKIVVAGTNVATLVDRAIPGARRERLRLRHVLSSLAAGDALIDRRVARHQAAASAQRRRPGLPDPLPLPELRLPPIPYPEPPVYPPPTQTYRPGAGGRGGADPLIEPKPLVRPPVTPPRVVRPPIIP